MASRRHVWSKFFPPGLSSRGDLLPLLWHRSCSASQSVAAAWSNWVDRTCLDWLVLITVTSSLSGSVDCDVSCWRLGIYSCTFVHNISIKWSTIIHIPSAHLLYCVLDIMPLHTCLIRSSIASTIPLPSGALGAKDIVHHIFNVRDSKIFVREKTRWHARKRVIVLCGHHMVRGCSDVVRRTTYKKYYVNMPSEASPRPCHKLRCRHQMNALCTAIGHRAYNYGVTWII